MGVHTGLLTQHFYLDFLSGKYVLPSPVNILTSPGVPLNIKFALAWLLELANKARPKAMSCGKDSLDERKPCQ